VGEYGEKWGMDLSGEFPKVILDEKNRITLPADLRKELDGSSIKISKGEDKCLKIYPLSKWEEMIGEEIKANTVPFVKRDRRLLRKYGAARTEKIDNAGRILIPDSLCEYAGLKKDCVILGQFNYIELWDKIRYENYSNEDNEENAIEFEAASEDLGRIIKRKKGIIET